MTPWRSWSPVLAALWSAGGENNKKYSERRTQETDLSVLSQVVDDGQTSSGLPLNRLSGLVLLMDH